MRYMSTIIQIKVVYYTWRKLFVNAMWPIALDMQENYAMKMNHWWHNKYKYVQRPKSFTQVLDIKQSK